MVKRAFVLLAILLNLNGCAQGDTKNMTLFVPRTNSFEIHYPKGFSLSEDKEGSVTIFDPASGLNITISAHDAYPGITDKMLIEQLSGFIRVYYSKEINEEDWDSHKTKFKILVDTKFSVGSTNWVWYGISDKQKIVTITLNKDAAIEQEDLDLIRSMIEGLVIRG